eukprot:375760_1
MSRFFKFLSSLSQPPAAKLDPVVKNLNEVPHEYDRGQPNYSAVLFDFMEPSFKHNCKAIVDVGAGTGKLTTLLTEYVDPSTKVYAIEPLENLRAKLTENLSNFNNVEIYDTLSDNLSFIDDNSIDAIFCGSSFHWFANISTMKEFERVLSGNNSYLMLVWNKLLWNDSRFFQEIRRDMRLSHDYDDVIRRQMQKFLIPQNLINHNIKSFERFTYKEINKTHQHKINGRLLLDLIVSTVHMQSLPIERQFRIIDQIRGTIFRYYGSLDAEIIVPYSTVLTFAKCNKTND